MDEKLNPKSLSVLFCQLYLDSSDLSEAESTKIWNNSADGQTQSPEVLEFLNSVPDAERIRFFEQSLAGGYYMFENAESPENQEWLRNFGNIIEIHGRKRSTLRIS